MPRRHVERLTDDHAKKRTVTTLFLDVGGVLLSPGWDEMARRRAARKFRLDWSQTEALHRLIVDTLEEGKITLDQYLDRVVFIQDRSFTRDRFRRFMFAQSKPHARMIELIARLKARYGLKVAVVSNEGRELNIYRIRKFRLDSFVDTFISSCFVHTRKPDPEMFRLALDIVNADPARTLYIDDTPMFAQVAEELGLLTILHTDYESTRARLASIGLVEG
jgi:putative hydrolase of the HAD superfamily